MPQAWQSYDSAAATHDRVAAPNIFAPPAKDLVARMGLATAGAILDVGTGTGIAALAALESSAPGAVVVGLDISLEMLRVAQNRGLVRVVAGAVPGLPFPAASFDGILANFVLTHVTDYSVALCDMVRVLRPRAKLGVTAWATTENEYREFWQSTAELFISRQALQTATQAALPWEDWFTNAIHLRQAFQDAGLIGIELQQMRYNSRMSIADFLDMREASIQARFMRQTLNAQRWEEFKRTLVAEFYRRFTDPIEHTRDVHIAIGTRP